MIRAVLDSNVLVSGILRRSPDAPSVKLIDAWRAGRFELVVSDNIIEEVTRTLNKPYFRRRLTDLQIAQAIRLLSRHAGRVDVTVTLEGVATHPEDDLILAAAVSSGAAFLVTGDSGLLGVSTLGEVRICSPRDFLPQLEI